MKYFSDYSISYRRGSLNRQGLWPQVYFPRRRLCPHLFLTLVLNSQQAKTEVSVHKSSTAGKRMAQVLKIHPVNGFHQSVEPQSTRRPNWAGPDHSHAPARSTRPEAFSGIVYISRAMDEVLAKIK